MAPIKTNDSTVRTDILPDDLKKVQPKFKVYAEQQFNYILENAEFLEGKQVTPKPAINIVEMMTLIKNAFEDYYTRTHVTGDARVVFSYEEPDKRTEFETITIKLDKREPGMYQQGRPGSGAIKQYRPLLREVLDDKDNAGYKRAILGQWYDNWITLTAWARTNKAANDRALWIENVMEEYAWYFGYEGLSRAPIYIGRKEERTLDVEGNRYYGRPIEYYVRTEKIRTVSQKELEEVCVRMALASPV